MAEPLTFAAVRMLAPAAPLSGWRLLVTPSAVAIVHPRASLPLRRLRRPLARSLSSSARRAILSPPTQPIGGASPRALPPTRPPSRRSAARDRGATTLRPPSLRRPHRLPLPPARRLLSPPVPPSPLFQRELLCWILPPPSRRLRASSTPPRLHFPCSRSLSRCHRIMWMRRLVRLRLCRAGRSFSAPRRRRPSPRRLQPPSLRRLPRRRPPAPPSRWCPLALSPIAKPRLPARRCLPAPARARLHGADHPPRRPLQFLASCRPPPPLPARSEVRAQSTPPSAPAPGLRALSYARDAAYRRQAGACRPCQSAAV